MRILLVDPDPVLRREVAELLHGFGLSVFGFANARIAFLFALAKLDELDAVVVNDDGDRADWLERRLAVASATPPVLLTYSGRRPERGTTISVPARPPAREPQRNSPRERQDLEALIARIAAPTGPSSAVPGAVPRRNRVPGAVTSTPLPR